MKGMQLCLVKQFAGRLIGTIGQASFQVATLAAVLAAGQWAQADIIFFEDFTGSAGTVIQGTAPDVGTGTWGGWADSVKLHGDDRGEGAGWDYATGNTLSYAPGAALELSFDVGVGAGDSNTTTMLQLNPDGSFWGAAAIVYLHPGGQWGINSSAGFSDWNALASGTVWNAAATAWQVPTASEMNNVRLTWNGVNTLSVIINGVTQTSVIATLPTITSVAIARNGGGYNAYDNVMLQVVPEPASLALLAAGGLLPAFRRRR
jgi:hypothetical protein